MRAARVLHLALTIIVLTTAVAPSEAEEKILAQVPDLKIVGWTVDDSAEGNGDGGLHPGETVYLQVWLSNQGNETARYVDGRLSEAVDHPDVEILDKFAIWPNLLGTGLPRVSIAPHFRIRVASTRPCNWEIPLRLELTADDGYVVEREFSLVMVDPQEIDLAGKSARPFYYGAGASDDFGFSMASGDINGDGYEDLLVGAPSADGYLDTRNSAGEVAVIYGGLPPRRDYDLSGPAFGHAFVYGADANDDLGTSVACCDLNGDGYDDLILGAVGGDAQDDGSRDRAGELVVIYGSSTWMSDIDLSSAANVALYWGALPSGRLGSSLACGDLDGDGYDDIIAGATPLEETAGRLEVIYGGPFMPTGVLYDFQYDPPGAVSVMGREEGFGDSVAAGDLNGDGYDDVIVGASRGDGPAGSRSNAGEATIIYGGPNRWTDIDVGSDDPGVTFVYGPHLAAYLGISVAAGDIDGDGYDDLILGAREGMDPSLTEPTGRVVVIYGGPDEFQDTDLASTASEAITIFGGNLDDWLGEAVASGDLDGDGYDDVVAGAMVGDGLSGQVNSGEAIVIHGRASRLSDINLASPPADVVRVYGIDDWDGLGRSVAIANINGDDYGDLILGAFRSDGPANLRVGAGELAVLPGGPRVKYRHDPDAYAFIDATAGTAVGLVCDDCAATIPIGFDFYFYGQPHDQITVSSNGYLTFGGTGDHLPSRCLPVANPPNDLIAVFWEDFNLEAGGEIYYLLEGTAPNRRLTVEWYQVPQFPDVDAATFEVTLFESTNQILFQYQDVDFGGTGAEGGGTGIIGVENGTGLNGTPLTCFNPAVAAGEATRWRAYGNPTVIWSDDMEVGDGGWSATGLWHRVAEPTCSPSSRSGIYSWYYGQDGTCNYDTGGANSGTLTSEVIGGLAQDAELSFWHRRDAESFGLTDLTTVEVQADGGGFDTLESIMDIDNAWTYVPEIIWFLPQDHQFSAFDLTGYVGQDVELRFGFDTVDANMNFFTGWMIDDVEVRACPVWDAGAAAASGSASKAVATPQPDTYCEGSSGRVDALGSYCAACSTLSYQWNEGGAPIPGATAVAYDIPSTQTPDLYDYTVEIACAANPACGATSNVAAVDVVQMPAEVSSTLVMSKTADGTGIEFHWDDSPGASDYVILSDSDPAGAFVTEVGSSSSGATGVVLGIPDDGLRFYIVAGRNPVCGVGPK